MKTFPLIAVFFVFFAVTVFSQSQNLQVLKPLTAHDSLMLSKIPEFIPSEQSLRRTIPAVVDNSILPFMRPLIGQVGLECGQASSIGNMFTYEINAKRKVLGSLPDNQYATHFTYNFINGGSDGGINYYETFEIVKYAGNPSVADYGGMASGGASRWMSGYDLYYKAMKNRVDNVYSIKTNTIDGLMTLKNWIYDHADGSDYGGMASFYSQFTSPPSVFPPGTPEAGKHVIYHWGSSPNHAMTIVGYHDSIRWDFNNDGQYTNNLDINGDGLVDMRDWEIGGFKMANTYGGISGWGDQGYSYMMYKGVADLSTQGGIWNSQVVIADVKENVEPQLTAKVNLTYPCRNKIKIMVGVSTDMLGSEPGHVLQFPMFDFQGGCNPMQGGGQSNIEIGLDLNPLLAYIEPGQQAKYFLMIAENDPTASSTGTINSFSLMDYSGANVVEIISTQSNVAILNNEVTKMTAVRAVNYDPVNIITNELPTMQLYQNNSIQLQAEGGTAPYFWTLMEDYDTIQDVTAFPLSSGTSLQVSNNDDGTASLDLPFEFPYYGKKYNRIYIAVDGFIMFEPSSVPWPYYVEAKSYLIQNKIIAPTLAKPFKITPANNDGIWAETGADYCLVRWKLSVSGQSGDSEVSMAAKLHKDGKIEFFYGTHNAATFVKKFAGISAGDGMNNIILNELGTFIPSLNQHETFTPQQEFNGISLSKAGVLNAQINEYYPNQTLSILVADQNNIRKKTNIAFEIEGVAMDYTVQSGGNEIIEFGEVIALNLQLQNLNNFSLGEGVLSISTEDPYFTITSSQVNTTALSLGETINLNNIFAVEVSTNVPNGHEVNFSLQLQTAEGIWSRPLRLIAYAPDLKLQTVNINDGENGILEPGETANLILTMQNQGGASLFDLSALISTSDAHLTILNAEATINQVLQNETWDAIFQIHLSSNALPMQIVELQLQVDATNGFTYQKIIPIVTSLIAENFETGSFDLYPWEMTGANPWTISTTTPYEGTYAAKSGQIGHNEFSTLALTYDVAFPDTLSFYYKVSSENTYDFLRFSVNGVQLNEWSGEKAWSRKAYLIQHGEQTFRWRYDKDGSVESGSDCAWIDYVVFPAKKIYTNTSEINEDAGFTLNVSPNPFIHQLNVKVNASKTGVFKLIVTDIHGRVLYSAEQNALAKNEYQFDAIINTEQQGVFFVILQTETQTLVKKVVRPGRF